MTTASPARIHYGHIARLVKEHGYGFLVDDGGLEWFFVGAGVRAGTLDALWLDQRVGFSAEWTAKGPRAVDIHFEQLD
jgi:cold shock CspA family protein